MPINTIQNWVNEFNMWIPAPEDAHKNPMTQHGEVRPRNFKIFAINDAFKSLRARTRVVREWKEEGGVLMMGYEMFRLLILKKDLRKKKRVDPNLGSEPINDNTFAGMYEALVNPGPSVIICDEGHRIKNACKCKINL